MNGLRARAAAYFLEPKPQPPTGDVVALVHREPPPLRPCDPPLAASPNGSWVLPEPVAQPVEPTRFAPRAAVLGPARHAVPAAAGLGCTLRRGFPAAVVATWSPGAAGSTPRGPGSPAAARIAARLASRGFVATAHGRIAWIRLDEHVVAASVAARRASAAVDVPFVLALAGPRCEIVETLLAEQDLVVVVTDEPDGVLARLAVAGCPCPAVACPPLRGPARALALAGFARPSDYGEMARS
jgi:hypothetical protein